jgi:tetraprenyl-beta-curcumene synthase
MPTYARPSNARSPFAQLDMRSAPVKRRSVGLRPTRIFARRRLAAQTGVALLRVNIRYWTMVAPLVRVQLRRWEQYAQAIPDQQFRALALRQLRNEGFYSEAAATLATLAPTKHRARVVEAIVASTVMAEYLNAVSEQPSSDPLRNGHRLYRAFREAVDKDSELTDDYYSCGNENRDDGGYLKQLASTVRDTLKSLPSARTVVEPMRRAAERYCEIEVRAHAVEHAGVAQLESWAGREGTRMGLHWRELLAGGAASVLCVDALLVAAAEEGTTPEQAAGLDRTYLFISALTTMLDSLVDREADLRAGKTNVSYLRYYDSDATLRAELLSTVRSAVASARTAPHAVHHVMTTVSAVAYYTSAPEASQAPMRSIVAPLHKELRPLIGPTLAVMRIWRAAKRLRARLRGEAVAERPARGGSRVSVCVPPARRKDLDALCLTS